MEFAKQFGEAAQKAVLSTIESGEWVKFPWMETLIKQAVREGLKGDVTIGGDYASNPLNAIIESKPLDICGCPFGSCTCTDEMRAVASAAKKHGVSPSVLKSIAKAESSENKKPIGGVVEVDEQFETNSFAHVEGYDWRIMVSDRTKNHRNSWVENFVRPPTQEEFEYQYRHFHARTHHVHVNHWVGGKWETITADYVPHWNNEKPVETFTATEEWPEGKKWRIKFHDQRVGRLNYVYFDSKPGGMNLAKYHTAKCFAVVEARPANV